MFFRGKEKRMIDMINLYREVFNSEKGQKILIDLAKSVNLQGTSFDPDPSQMSFNEGQKSVLLRILRTIETDPARLIELIKQAGQSEE